MRLKNLSLSCQLPDKWRRKANLGTARIYVQGQNLVTITNYIGLDPETLSVASLLPLKMLTMGLQIGP